MSRVLGRSFKISKKQAKGYGYAKPGMKRNPGVTTIAAINGRGSYATANRSARSVMSKLKRNARPAAARRALTSSERAAFKARMDRARSGHRSMSANRSTSTAQSASSKRNIRKAQRARKAWGKKLTRGKRFRVGAAAYGRKPKARRLKAGVYVANRRKKAGSKTMARRRKRAASPIKKRRSSKRRRKSIKSTAAAPKRRRRKARKGAARRKTAAKKTVTRRRRRKSSKKHTANRRRRHAKKAAPKRRRRKARKSVSKRRRRTTTKRRSSARRRRSGRKLKANSRRRKHRRNPRRKHRRNKGLKANRRRRTAKRSHKMNSRRRRHRRNGRSLFKRNGVGGLLKVGATVLAGFALHRVLSNMIAPRLMALVAPAAAPAAATSGYDQTNIYGLATNLGVAGLAGFALHKLVKNDETRRLLIGGVVASAAQSLVVSLLQKFAPGAAADALAGPESTATRISAMYGLGGAASIMPHYQSIGRPVQGMGEYFAANGLGEYFSSPMNGLGEYFAATNGLGTYEPNGDLMQAAAGMGSHEYQGNHIDPSGDLDRQLTIAEAAAGIGTLFPYSAAAGMGGPGLMQAAAGFGTVDTVPSGDTWIPGTTDGQIWAGTRSITNDQGVNQMQPAGVLETEGGQGIFG